MTNDLIAKTFEALIALELCSSRTEFSERWLGREKSYYRSVVAREGTVSMGAHTYLVGRLRSIGALFCQSGINGVVDRGAALIELCDECFEYLLERAAADAWLDLDTAGRTIDS